MIKSHTILYYDIMCKSDEHKEVNAIRKHVIDIEFEGLSPYSFLVATFAFTSPLGSFFLCFLHFL